MKKFFLTFTKLTFLLLIMNSILFSISKSNEVVFYIVRHGKTMLNTTDRVQGWSDAVLTPAGIEVAEYLGSGIKDKKIRFISAYSSDSGRSMQTANIILDKIGQKNLTLKTDWRLREFNFGTYEGDLNHTLWTDIAKRKGITMQEWLDAGVSPEEFANSTYELDLGKVQDGINWPAENYKAITTRLTESINDIAKETSKKGGGNVLIVSHGLSIVALINTLDPNLNAHAGLKNASVTKVIYKNGKYEVKDIGDMSYVELGEKITKK